MSSPIGSPELDRIYTAKFQKDAWKNCKHCNARPMMQRIEYFMPLWNSGLMMCNNCKAYLGEWEAEAFALR